MKRITIGIVSGIVLIALILGVLPVAASESEANIAETGNYLSQPSYYPSALGSSPVPKYEYPPLTTPIGEHFTFTVSATDPDNDPLIYSASNLPPGATFDPQTGTFSWTPGYDQAGVYPNIHFEVSDGEFTDSEDITITVINVDRPPVLDFVGDKLVNEEELIQFIIKATDPDGDPMTYTASNLPQGATFAPQTRTFFWTPGSGQQGSYPGIRFEVSDGELTDFEDITITVNGNAEKTPEEAVFSVSSLRVRPGKVNAGKQVRIGVLATNIGTVTGSYEVILRINDIIEDNRIVNLSPGATEEVEFIVIKDTPGIYTVGVNGLSDSFVVREAEKSRGRAKNVSINSILSKTVGWIRVILQEGGDA
jgi:hypothetical protein